MNPHSSSARGNLFVKVLAKPLDHLFVFYVAIQKVATARNAQRAFHICLAANPLYRSNDCCISAQEKAGRQLRKVAAFHGEYWVFRSAGECDFETTAN